MQVSWCPPAGQASRAHRHQRPEEGPRVEGPLTSTQPPGPGEPPHAPPGLLLLTPRPPQDTCACHGLGDHSSLCPGCSLGTVSFLQARLAVTTAEDPGRFPHNFSGLAFALPFAYFKLRQHQVIRTVQSTQTPFPDTPWALCSHAHIPEQRLGLHWPAVLACTSALRPVLPDAVDSRTLSLQTARDHPRKATHWHSVDIHSGRVK